MSRTNIFYLSKCNTSRNCCKSFDVSDCTGVAAPALNMLSYTGLVLTARHVPRGKNVGEKPEEYRSKIVHLDFTFVRSKGKMIKLKIDVAHLFIYYCCGLIIGLTQ